MMKRILTSLLMTLAALPLLAGSGTVTIDDIVYGYSFEKEVHIVSGGTSTYHFSGSAYVLDGSAAAGNVEILPAVTVPDGDGHVGLSVTFIAQGAFGGNNNITHVTVPDGVSLEGIGGSHFLGCTNLKSISLPAGTGIPHRCFMSCTSLETVTLRGAISSIGEDAFRGCTSLLSIDLSKGVNVLGRAFYDCPSLKNVTLPETGLTEIGEFCFSRTSIEYLNIPASVTRIGSSICHSCYSLKEVVIQNCDDFSGQSHFLDCKNLTKATIIGEFDMPSYMFIGCTKLKSVTLNKVKTIGYEAFQGCSSLESITIPSTVSTIRFEAFQYCDALKNVIIPSSVTDIQISAFKGCSALNSIKLPSNLSKLGAYAFQDCTDLQSLTFPASMTELGYEAFKGCTDMKLIDLHLSTQLNITDTDRNGNYFKGVPESTVILLPGESVPHKGDANGDDEVSVTDIALVVNYILSLGNDGFNIYGADANGDGQVTVTDIGVIVDMILGNSGGNARRMTDDGLEPQ